MKSENENNGSTPRVFIVVPIYDLRTFNSPEEAQKHADKLDVPLHGAGHTVVEVVAEWNAMYSTSGKTKGHGFRRLPVGSSFYVNQPEQ